MTPTPEAQAEAREMNEVVCRFCGIAPEEPTCSCWMMSDGSCAHPLKYPDVTSWAGTGLVAESLRGKLIPYRVGWNRHDGLHARIRFSGEVYSGYGNNEPEALARAVGALARSGE